MDDCRLLGDDFADHVGPLAIWSGDRNIRVPEEHAAGDVPGLGALSMVDYMGLNLRHMDTTETGGEAGSGIRRVA